MFTFGTNFALIFVAIKNKKTGAKMRVKINTSVRSIKFFQLYCFLRQIMSEPIGV
jgi:hypothetical protein